MSDANLINLINTAKYLNDRLIIGNNDKLQEQVQSNKVNIQQQEVELQDIKDAIQTYNREYIERQNEINQKGDVVPATTLQDWALYVFFFGFGLFSLAILIFIFRFSKKAFLLGIVYIILSMLLYVCFVFIIQRFG